MTAPKDRCPHCRAVLPPPKTCPVCGQVFYRSEGGRTDATYCSVKCGAIARMRRFREKHPGKLRGKLALNRNYGLG